MSNPLMNAITWMKHEDKLSPTAALIFCFMWLQGGQFTHDEGFNFLCKWTDKHGEPTWKKVEAFAREHEIDANICRPLVERVAKEQS